MKNTKQFHITVLGVHVKSEGYPNVKWRLHSIACTNGVQIYEINYPFRSKNFTQSKLIKIRFFKLLLNGFRVIYAHIRVIIFYLIKKSYYNVYIPYPAVFLLYIISFIPQAMRPKFIIADAFISLYDTIVNDRRLLAKDGILANILKQIEARAYAAADRIIVDTKLSSEYFISTFNISINQVKALPLSINQNAYEYKFYHPNDQVCRVLFIGTFVPLQGVETIARAIKLLKGLTNIHFTLIGSGQSANAVREILGSDLCNYVWHETWHTSSQLAKEIQQSDICLGIFGSGEKAQRVWPLKNYAYMSVGRAMITGDTLQARELSKLSCDPLFLSVPVNNHHALAEAIRNLASLHELRCKLSSRSHLFFQQHFNDQIAIEYILSQFLDN